MASENTIAILQKEINILKKKNEILVEQSESDARRMKESSGMVQQAVDLIENYRERLSLAEQTIEILRQEPEMEPVDVDVPDDFDKR